MSQSGSHDNSSQDPYPLYSRLALYCNSVDVRWPRCPSEVVTNPIFARSTRRSNHVSSNSTSCWPLYTKVKHDGKVVAQFEYERSCVSTIFSRPFQSQVMVHTSSGLRLHQQRAEHTEKYLLLPIGGLSPFEHKSNHHSSDHLKQTATRGPFLFQSQSLLQLGRIH